MPTKDVILRPLGSIWVIGQIQSLTTSPDGEVAQVYQDFASIKVSNIISGTLVFPGRQQGRYGGIGEVP